MCNYGSLCYGNRWKQGADMWDDLELLDRGRNHQKQNNAENSNHLCTLSLKLLLRKWMFLPNRLLNVEMLSDCYNLAIVVGKKVKKKFCSLKNFLRMPFTRLCIFSDFVHGEGRMELPVQHWMTKSFFITQTCNCSIQKRKDRRTLEMEESRKWRSFS